MFLPPEVSIPEEPPDEYVPIFGPQQVQALVNVLGIHLRKMGGQIDITAEEIVAITGCSAYVAYVAYADAATYAAAAKNRDDILSQFAECIVQILVKMGVKAAAFLDLAPLE